VRRRCVILATPHEGAADTAELAAYARACVRASIRAGEAPLVGPLVYAHDDILDVSIPAERRMGVEAALAWLSHAQVLAVYIDHGVTPQMREAMDRAAGSGVIIDVRRLNATAAAHG
jgi:hypothetical protein